MAMVELFQIQRKYPVGKDEHYMFSYLANPFVEGPSRRDLVKMKLSEMKKVFEKEHGKEAISLIRMLLLACSNDKDSSDKLKRHDSCAEAQFAGKSVKPEKREEYNLRQLLVNVVKDLDESQLKDMATLIEDDAMIICEDKPTKLQNLLLQLERAFLQTIILPQKVDKLIEWLEVLGRDDLISRVNQFDPKKQFPGAAAVDEVVVPVQNQSEHRSEQGGQNVPVQDQTELHRQLSRQEGQNAMVPVASEVNRIKSWKSGDSCIDSAYEEDCLDYNESSRSESGCNWNDPSNSSTESTRSSDSALFPSDSQVAKAMVQLPSGENRIKSWNKDYLTFGSTYREEEIYPSRGFTEAKQKALVPFLYHDVIECNCEGQNYTIDGHDITLRIPKGAVAEREIVHIEIAVAMYGPFKLPRNAQPISPIVWVCLLEDNATLKKPFQLIVPHFLAQISEERIHHHNVKFSKANHIIVHSDDKVVYELQDCNTTPLFTSIGYRSYGVLITNHFCFYCLKANRTPELAKDAGYSLVRLEKTLTPTHNEVDFVSIYLLETCLRSLKEQFDGHSISRCSEFKFKADDDEPSIKLDVPREHQLCDIAMDPMAAEIKASDIDFWGKGFDTMRIRHELKMYPPRVKMTVSMKASDSRFKLPIKFIGCSGDSQLDTELIFPLCLSSPSSPTSNVSPNTDLMSHKIMICEKPELCNALEQLKSIRAQWKDIGIHLKLPIGTLEAIEHDHRDCNNQLRAMLTEWLQQVTPTWAQLISAVKKLNESVAEEIESYLRLRELPDRR